ncbi:RNA polymerase sigma-70 factor [Reichenbachiella carrageenanivorans]|uniref:RNA polymerase sigma-70 factor n=1 Tax=Reichenbachiella carrageenanivorans TaxID=2979869 RepID=A0ABY6CZJ0_9BACT|nr:RNA polymerase sigma-70 factor [Reichenbachiella carrageenanivorans]UXX79327.1 RNA polymerase sigma-70 factor [Reichenbachiella carrageenanivorans]
MLDNQVNLLVQRIINKDKSAFEIVFNEYYKALCNYAYRFVDEYEEAEEIVQDVFVKFWEKCDTIAQDSSLKSYLYRSVHNTCLNYLKHLKVRDSYRQFVIEQMAHVEDDEYEKEGEKNLQAEIYKAIDDLPPQCGKIFKLSRFEGLKYQEIADHMGLSIKTIEVQMGKALRVLRESLKEFRR